MSENGVYPHAISRGKLRINQWILEYPIFRQPEWTSIAIKATPLTNSNHIQKMSKWAVKYTPIPWNTGFWRRPLIEELFLKMDPGWKHLLSMKKLTNASEVDEHSKLQKNTMYTVSNLLNATMTSSSYQSGCGAWPLYASLEEQNSKGSRVGLTTLW